MTDDQHDTTESTEHQPEDTAQQEATGNREAAKYRRQLREVEAERDQLREQVHTLRRTEIERQVADSLEDPSDLWRAGTELGNLLDTDGGIDQAKVDETVLAVTTEHPAWRKRPPIGPDEDQGKKTEHHRSPSWAGLLRSPQQS